MATRSLGLPQICPTKLDGIYNTLFELQQKLNISDEFLLNTSRDLEVDAEQEDSLKQLLRASKATRETLITWYLKRTLVEINVTISLLTAKIKFIEYKLGLCDGLDLHQACSLSLVDFCNILSDLTVVRTKPMHQIAREEKIPVWLSHYRNQICHVPSESPCISILVPLVVKSLDYLRGTFWLKLLERETFDGRKCKRVVVAVSRLTSITSLNSQLVVKDESKLSKKKLKSAKDDFYKATRFCSYLKKMLLLNPDQTIQVVVSFLANHKPLDSKRNYSLILEQVIKTQSIERLFWQLVNTAEGSREDEVVVSWLITIARLIGMGKKEKLKQALRAIGINPTLVIVQGTNIAPVRCCRIAYRLIQSEDPNLVNLLPKFRLKLMSALGRGRAITLFKIGKLASTVGMEQ